MCELKFVCLNDIKSILLGKVSLVNIFIKWRTPFETIYLQFILGVNKEFLCLNFILHKMRPTEDSRK